MHVILVNYIHMEFDLCIVVPVGVNEMVHRVNCQLVKEQSQQLTLSTDDHIYTDKLMMTITDHRIQCK